MSLPTRAALGNDNSVGAWVALEARACATCGQGLLVDEVDLVAIFELRC
jgi:hypothetical protein